MDRPFIALFRRVCRNRMMAKGYSKEQANKAVGKLGDGQILEWLKTYGPKILEIIKIIMPFLLMLLDEPPAGQPAPWLDEDDDDGGLA